VGGFWILLLPLWLALHCRITKKGPTPPIPASSAKQIRGRIPFLTTKRSHLAPSGQIEPNEVRHIIRILYMDKSDAAPSGELIIDPWARREQERIRGKAGIAIVRVRQPRPDALLYFFPGIPRMCRRKRMIFGRTSRV
jgi:hypothetical protein